MRKVPITILILLLAAAPAGALAGDRIAWDPGPPPIGFRHNGAQPGGDLSARPILISELRGQSLSFSPADTALFAVFLAGPAEMSELLRQLHSSGAGALFACAGGFSTSPQATPPPASLGFCAQRLRIGSNGTVKVRADEGRHPGKNLLAVVNATGEILSVRPLWRAVPTPADMVVARP